MTTPRHDTLIARGRGGLLLGRVLGHGWYCLRSVVLGASLNPARNSFGVGFRHSFVFLFLLNSDFHLKPDMMKPVALFGKNIATLFRRRAIKNAPSKLDSISAGHARMNLSSFSAFFPYLLTFFLTFFTFSLSFFTSTAVSSSSSLPLDKLLGIS